MSLSVQIIRAFVDALSESAEDSSAHQHAFAVVRVRRGRGQEHTQIASVLRSSVFAHRGSWSRM
jgi:hypothetical protein